MRIETESRQLTFSFWVDVLNLIVIVASTVMFLRGGADHWLQALALVIVGAALLSWFLRRWLQRFVHLWTYVYDVIPEFDLKDNRKVWERSALQKQYWYVGISGQTMEQEFRKAVSDGVFQAGTQLRFLLLKPFSESVKQSREHELGNAAEASQIAADAVQTSQRIASCSSYYATLNQRSGLRAEVRFTAVYIGYWAHFVGNDEVLVGPLFKGQPGYRTTVLNLRGNQNPLLRFYQDEFERLWASAESFEASQQSMRGSEGAVS